MKPNFKNHDTSFDYDNDRYGMNWISYNNGNYTVHLNLDDGTKVRENDLDTLEAAFPESMDLKITNKCHNGCTFCHENSTCDGKHGDILSPSFIDKLHPYTEIAIGGGNPLEHPDLDLFLLKLQQLKMIPSMTIRQNDFMDNLPLLRKFRDNKLIYGLGISLVDPSQEGFIEAIKEFPNAVIHVINGVTTMEDLRELAFNNLKILILGYKEVRRGKDLYKHHYQKIEGIKDDIYYYLPEMISNGWFNVVSFDNLAIKQLNPQRLMNKTQWDEMYMGDDGIDGEMTSASMFIDMVERQFARNSCSMERYSLMDDITDMYNHLRNKT